MHPHHPPGFSLLEVLISLILLSITLLGMDMMEVFATREIFNNHYTAMAEQQLENIAERLSMAGEQGDIGEQIAAWNAENQIVLPQGRGEVRGAWPTYQIKLCWGNTTGNEQKYAHCLRNDVG